MPVKAIAKTLANSNRGFNFKTAARPVPVAQSVGEGKQTNYAKE